MKSWGGGWFLAIINKITTFSERKTLKKENMVNMEYYAGIEHIKTTVQGRLGGSVC